ncbi:hypothetical protein SAMN02745225_02134 [Ferrithrix thermotolerans DSM 19514]|uniref:Putative membrane protein insertion efficiency factor n=1 Tax=Ferrithrix thermotolerans DSM 19514 TaxID=1121881 RepID=A0A1M4XU97_9ACTN|nr:hypothetical protein SAMN02745225_02134 [Ferrithrix thermotolerans DSM 19514]
MPRKIGESRNLLSKFMIFAIHVYQKFREGKPSPCRFMPSCSEYAVEAIEVHGPVHGSLLAVKRIARCNPFGSSGIDLVPPRKGQV